MVPDLMPRTARAAAILAPAMLIGLDLADGATRPGYQLTRHWVSHLSLGDRGWLGTVKLVTVGLLVVASAIGLRGQARAAGATPRRATWRSVMLAGLALMAAAVFPIDPGLNYPPGAAAVQTWQGGLHDIAGLVVVAALSVTAWRLGRDLDLVRAHRGQQADNTDKRTTGERADTPGRLAGEQAGPARDPAVWRHLGRGVATIVVTAFLTCATLVTLDHAGLSPGAPGGLFERIAVYAGITWLGVAGARLMAHRRRPQPAARH
ncbi:DUF998 domain-containing protein [Micromonospora sp. NPDC049891]|uniref:DUF998 domain-containing protein n=1 Tax=Micromonospora sp. NPDC049891 TaxID=3155655 RepID=UPI00340B4B0D